MTTRKFFLCRHINSGAMNSSGKTNGKYQYQCCSGFCIDLLAKFADDLKFEYELIRAEDPKWGTLKVMTFSFLFRLDVKYEFLV